MGGGGGRTVAGPEGPCRVIENICIRREFNGDDVLVWGKMITFLGPDDRFLPFVIRFMKTNILIF